MPAWIEIVGPEKSVHLFGVRLVGVNAVTANKILLTLAVLVAVWLLTKILRVVARAILQRRDDMRARFWSRQAIQLLATSLFLLLAFSIWFDQPGRIAASFGLITAGLAVALQRVVLAVAAYFVILRGNVFNVGDRIAMGGVRGDVIALGYARTTIMEMGQPPAVQDANPAMWVGARQFTGRIVTVTNDKIFDEPVFNYSRDFPYIWEEIRVPVPHGSDHRAAEAILLEAATRHTHEIASMDAPTAKGLRWRYGISFEDAAPRVYLRVTDNWLELTVRFLAPDHDVRSLKDAITRDIVDGFAAANLEVGSTTISIVKSGGLS